MLKKMFIIGRFKKQHKVDFNFMNISRRYYFNMKILI